MTTIMHTSPDRVFHDLTTAQADGLACVWCGTDYLTARVATRPVGRSETGSQVFACVAQCADAFNADAVQGQQMAAAMVAMLTWFAARDKERERAQREARHYAVRRAAEATPTPPCPSWCTAGAGHPYGADFGDDKPAIRRTHEAAVFKTEGDGHGVSIMQDERLVDGTVTLGAPEVYIEWDSEDPETVRACGRALANAAVMLEKIATGSL
jgi:hypothetical protein